MNKNNSLATLRPDLAEEWNWEKNGELTPSDVTCGSNKKVWWMCKYGHEWMASINNRNRGTGCPYDAGKKVHKNNSLATLRPDLAEEWNYKKNRDLTPSDVTYGSGKKVWWKCKHGHEWEDTIAHRTDNRNCPYCSGHRPCEDNCLATLNPQLAEEWNYEKNGGLIPNEVACGSNKKVWWKCRRGHEWEASVNNRNRTSDCPYCSGKRACEDNSLATLNPKLAEEWHYEKNRDLTSNDVTCGSGRKVWWKCKEGHEWDASVYSRNAGAGCPDCHCHTSFEQASIVYYLRLAGFEVKNNHRHVYDSKGRWVEVDIQIITLGQPVEYDSLYYHKDKVKQDENKNKILAKTQSVIRVRESGLPQLKYDHEVISRDLDEKKSLDKCINKLLMKLNEEYGLPLNINLNLRNMVVDTEKDRIEIYKLMNKLEVEESLFCVFPEVAVEWNYEKNGSLSPRHILYGTGRKVWWKCKRGHEWEASVLSRSRGRGCPYCSNKKVCVDNSLATLRPDLAEEWNHEKNGDLTPNDVTCGSDRKAWWKCKRGHEWEATVDKRNSGRKCPFCSNKKVDKANSLAIVKPELVLEWNYEKNKKINPEDVSCGSKKKVWWKCKHGHEWESSIDNRNRGTGCPECWKEKRYNSKKIV